MITKLAVDAYMLPPLYKAVDEIYNRDVGSRLESSLLTVAVANMENDVELVMRNV